MDSQANAENRPETAGVASGASGSSELHVYLIDDCEYVGAWSKEDALRYHATSPHRHEETWPTKIIIADGHNYHEDGYAPNGDGKCTMIEQAEEMTQNVRRPAFHVGIPCDLL